MEVTVTKFERHMDLQKASVTFAIKKLNSNFSTIMASCVDLQGTDDDMVKAAWAKAQPDVTYWLSTTEKSVVGSSFNVELPTETVTNTVTTEATEIMPTNAVNTDATEATAIEVVTQTLNGTQ